jgi:TfoX/Sxy family transcriptional regulator of competence genes
MAAKRTKEPDESELAFAQLAETISKDPRVDPPDKAGAKGFGSKGLKVARKLFAFRSSNGRLVLKLPGERVEALASSGQGKRFDPGHGRVMKEWIAIDLGSKPLWARLAREALEFAARNATPEATRRRRTTRQPQPARRRR